MNKQYKMNVSVAITFDCTEKADKDISMAIESALSLAINPNYHTIENGVKLVEVEILANENKVVNL